MIGLEQIRGAVPAMSGVLHRTPLVGSATLSRLAGREIFLKLESFQKTGSFKPRGALTKLRSLTPEELARGVITISAGNHAQGVAYVATLLGARSVVVMPAAASPMKADAARAYGAEVILHGNPAEAFAKVEEIRSERNLVFVHPFDDDATIAGQGTVGLEIMEDLPGVDCVVVPIGGGGLIAGVALAVKSMNPRARVIGVEPVGAAAMLLSREQGKPARLPRTETIADGLAAPFAGERNFEIVEKHVDDLVVVEDASIKRAMRLLLERCKLLAEPAGAASLAAILEGKIAGAGRTALVVSGGNVSLETLAACLSP
ncbi:MAG TPA: threonine/serine dehydratase [Candidatus Polarisedimenticolia bacterium]|nr:threonine/serine dehydratase [Candidatus Polarisedimenticolia bacterium]